MSAKDVINTYTALHANKIGAHWLWTAIERVVAGEDEAEIMRDFGYTDQIDRLKTLEIEHAEFFDRWHDERRKREALEQAILQHRADRLDGKLYAALDFAAAIKEGRPMECRRREMATRKVGAGGTEKEK